MANEANLTLEQKKAAASLDAELQHNGGLATIAPDLAEKYRLNKRVENGPQAINGLGTDTWDQSVNNYRNYGADLQRRTGPVLDQGQANQSRGLQMNALDALRAQADGSAPSSAVILSQRANQDAIRNAALQTTGAKSAGAGIASQRGAGEAAGQSMLAGNAQNANARAAEISHGQNSYFGGAAGMRGQDINAATTQAQLTAGQRALNEAGQQGYEQMGYDTRAAQAAAGSTAQGQHDADAAALKQAINNKNQAETSAAFQGASTVAGGASGFLAGRRTGSDERMKTHIDSLSSLRGRY